MTNFNETETWLLGARVGFFCGLVLGLGTGCAGAMFWISLARSLA